MASCAAPREEPGEGGGRPLSGGVLRLSEDPDIRSWDPVEVGDVVTSSVVGPVYEGLLRYDPRHAERLIPALARSWESSDGGHTYRFVLRASRFADDPCFPGGRGRAVTAADVRFSLERAFRARPLPEMLSLAWRILGARDLAEGTASSLAGVECPSDSVVVIRLDSPCATFPHLLASNIGWIVPREAVEMYAREFWRHPVGAGPFRLALWDPVRRVLLARNENYWERDSLGTPLPYLDGISFSLARERFPVDARSLHVASVRLVEDSTASAETAGLHRYMETHRFNTIFLAWTMDRVNVWTRDVRLRRAVALAACGWSGPRGHTSAHGLLPPGIPGHREDIGMFRDPGASRRLLAEAGHPDGRGLPPLVVQVMEGEEFYASRLLDALGALGIRLSVTTLSRPEHWAEVAAGSAEFFRGGWIADYPDPENLFEIFSSDSPRNSARFRDARYDSLYRRLVSESDPGSRRALSAALEDVLLEECPAVFLCHEHVARLLSPQVRGFELSMNPLTRSFYQYVWLDPRESRP
jgi:peptide/nickel transport system substrate-binding protein